MVCYTKTEKVFAYPKIKTGRPACFTNLSDAMEQCTLQKTRTNILYDTQAIQCTKSEPYQLVGRVPITVYTPM